MPPPEATPGSFRVLFAMFPTVLNAIRRGQTNDAFAAPFIAGRRLGSRHGPWLFCCAALSILVGLTVVLGTVVPALFSGTESLSAGGLLTRFFGPALVTTMLFLLRVLTVRWTFTARQIPLGAAGAGNIVATAAHAYGFFWAVLLPLTLFPGLAFGLLRLVIGSLLAVVVLIVAEILIYAGIARAVPAGQPDPLIPHTLLTLVWFALIGLVLIVLGVIAAAALVDTLFSTFGGLF